MEYKYKYVSFDHQRNELGSFNDLVDKYEKYGTLYVGVDFDNTVLPYQEQSVEGHFGYNDLIQVLKDAKKYGLKICLWTVHSDEDNLKWKIDWFTKHGFEPDFVNDSPLCKHLGERRKPHFNILLDDCAGLETAYRNLYNIVRYIEHKNNIRNV